MSSENFNEVVKHFHSYVDYIEEYMDTHSESEDLVTYVERYEFFESLIHTVPKEDFDVKYSNEFKVLGKGSYGLVIRCKSYPSVVYKWYFDDFDDSPLHSITSDYKYIGYDYATLNKGDLPNISKLPRVYYNNSDGVIMEYLEFNTVENILEKDIWGDSEFENNLSRYFDFIVANLSIGYFISDLNESNMSFNSLTEPILTDLDLFVKSTSVTETCKDFSLTAEDKYATLELLNVFGTSYKYKLYVIDSLNRLTECAKGVSTISTDPLN